MGHRNATDAQQPAAAGRNTVMVVAHDGTVVSVLEAPEPLPAKAGNLSVGDLWQDELAGRVHEHVRRAIRSREVHSDEARDPADGRRYEFIFIPQGRNRVLLLARDISATLDALSRIRELAFTDELTGLPNREFLLQELGKVTGMQRLREGRAAVLCLHVETPDDYTGTPVTGLEDELLQELASRLMSQLRGMNDRRQRDFERYSALARTDFRQFTIVLPSIDTGEDAEAVMLRIIEALSRPVAVGTREARAAVAGGIALFPQDGTDAESLYRNAVAALQDARNARTGSFRFHSGTVRLRNLQRQDLAADIRNALDNGKFAVEFLPVFDARSGEPRSIEALLRWPEAVLGSRSTRKIIAIAEYTGIITEIGDWVLRRTCEQLAECKARGYDGLRASVNLSNQEFAATDLVDRVEKAISDSGLEPADIELEVREHMIYRDALQSHATCRALKSAGVGIVIDDFGTGACTLAHLSQCPADAIKIDISFVANMASSRPDRAACDAAIALAHGLGMAVIAEGVESEQQARLLGDSGCDALQGFLFSKPLRGDDLLARLGEDTRASRGEARAS